MKLKNPTPIFIYLLLLGMLSACVDKDFENPEISKIPFDPDKVLTVSELKQYASEGEAKRFDEDYSVFLTITMDDKSGNIYRAAFGQDETGGINLRLMSPGALYQGDYVRINLKNTTISQYQKLYQIDSINVDKNIEKLATWACEKTIYGEPKPVVEPTDVTINGITADLFQSQLIRLSDVQFVPYELGLTYGDTIDQFTAVNRTLMDCDGNAIIVRTSGFAYFADYALPEGKGDLIAVASRFRDDFQLLIRDSDEANLYGPRCEDDYDDEDVITIQEIRDLFDSGTTSIPANSIIRATVVSDRDGGNMPSRNAVLMDNSGAGIMVRFNSNHDYNLGSLIKINAGSLPLEVFNGLLQINNVPNGNVALLGSGQIPDPVEATIGNVLANMDEYESKLVTFTNTTISGGTTFAVPGSSHGNLDLNDGTGTITLFTYNWADFAGANVPSGTVTITGIVSVYNNPQFLIRNLNDIQ